MPLNEDISAQSLFNSITDNRRSDIDAKYLAIFIHNYANINRGGFQNSSTIVRTNENINTPSGVYFINID